MRKLLIPRDVFDQLHYLIFETPDGLETGVTLFGTPVSIPPVPSSAKKPNGTFKAVSFAADVVLAVAGPGKRATHEPAHYSGDENHSNEIFEALRCALPNIEWLGELHVHPRGMTWLSGGDLRTVRQILTGQDDTVHPEAFIAGVMQRRNGSVDIYPWHFTRDCLQGDVMELHVVESNAPIIQQARLKGVHDARPSVCAQPEGGSTTEPKAPRHHWLRQWRERLGGYGGKIRLWLVHVGRSREPRV